DRTFDRLRVRVEQELRRVEPVPPFGRVGAVHPEAVALARADAREVAVPGVRGALRERNPRLVVRLVEQAQLHPLRVLGEEREVRAVAVPGRAEREWPT